MTRAAEHLTPCAKCGGSGGQLFRWPQKAGQVSRPRRCADETRARLVAQAEAICEGGPAALGAQPAKAMTFPRGSVKGFLLDITGVLYNSSPDGGLAIPGSIDAVKRLYAESQLRFVSNESTSTPAKLLEKLTRLGFEGIKQEHLFTPAPVAARYIQKHGHRPHLLVHPGVLKDFDECDTNNPNCVVVGDAEDDFTYDNMNKAFRVLMNSERPLLISLGCGRFYQRVTGPCMDLGGFAMALKYATDCEHVVLGKPDLSYFMAAIEDMGVTKDEVVMVGDDIVSDVGGAQSHGIRAVQVRTGKWRPEWEKHYVCPDLIANNLMAAVRYILDE